MEKIMTRNGVCAVIRDNGVGLEIDYLGQHHSFPEVQGKKTASYPALIPGWVPKPSKRDVLRSKKN